VSECTVGTRVPRPPSAVARGVTVCTRGPFPSQATSQEEGVRCGCIYTGRRREMLRSPSQNRDPSTPGRLKAAFEWASGSGRMTTASPDVRSSSSSSSSSSSGAGTPRYVRDGEGERGGRVCVGAVIGNSTTSPKYPKWMDAHALSPPPGPSFPPFFPSSLQGQHMRIISPHLAPALPPSLPSLSPIFTPLLSPNPATHSTYTHAHCISTAPSSCFFPPFLPPSLPPSNPPNHPPTHN
jgi:hypothetical protein